MLFFLIKFVSYLLNFDTILYPTTASSSLTRGSIVPVFFYGLRYLLVPLDTLLLFALLGNLNSILFFASKFSRIWQILSINC